MIWTAAAAGQPAPRDFTLGEFKFDTDKDGKPGTDADLKNVISKGALVKILGRGELGSAVHVKAHKFSRSAEAAITGAGGTVEVLPPPFGNGRPPVKGNAHANR